MATTYPVPHRRVLADAIPGGLARDVALVLGASAFVGVAAQIAIPLPFTPVPLTLQTFAVLVSGIALGSTRGLLALSLYVAVGCAGVPWFSAGSSGWGGPTFGYILGFLAAAVVAGRLAERGWDRTPLRVAGLMGVGTLVIWAVGTAWLAADQGLGLATALQLGVYPFVPGDLVKIAMAMAALPTAWALVGRRDS